MVERLEALAREAGPLTLGELADEGGVADDGVGFAVDAERPATSFGLRGMRQRAERVAGRLDVESEPGGGTAVSAQLPAVWAGGVTEAVPRRTGAAVSAEVAP